MNEELLNIVAQVSDSFDFEMLQDNFDMLESSNLLNCSRPRQRCATNDFSHVVP